MKEQKQSYWRLIQENGINELSSSPNINATLVEGVSNIYKKTKHHSHSGKHWNDVKNLVEILKKQNAMTLFKIEVVKISQTIEEVRVNDILCFTFKKVQS